MADIVKATYGLETRKWKLNSYDGSKHEDLVNVVRNEFGIEASKVQLKYRDSDGDLIQLASDEDLKLALETEKTLIIVVSNESEELPTSLNEFRSSLTTLISDATRLVNSLDTLSFPEKKANPINTRDAVSSPVKSEPIATIDPSVLEEVHLNDAPNGTIHETKPPTYDNGIQSFPIKSSHSDGPLGYSQQQQNPLPPLNHAQPPVSAPLPPPPTSNYGQEPQHFQPPSSGYSPQQQNQNQPPSSGFGQQQNYPPSGLPPSSFNPGQQNQAPPTSNYGQQQNQAQLNSFQRPPGAPTQFQPTPTSIPSSQPPSFPPVQPPTSALNSNQPPTSMPLPPAGYGQQPQQFTPSSIYGQQQQNQPSYLSHQQPPSSFNPGAPSQNPFQRPSMTPTQLPPSAMPPPPTSYQQQHY